MGKVETVKIAADNESGFVIINKSDLTEDHKIYVEKASTRKAANGPKEDKE